MPLVVDDHVDLLAEADRLIEPDDEILAVVLERLRASPDGHGADVQADGVQANKKGG